MMEKLFEAFYGDVETNVVTSWSFEGPSNNSRVRQTTQSSHKFVTFKMRTDFMRMSQMEL